MRRGWRPALAWSPSRPHACGTIKGFLHQPLETGIAQGAFLLDVQTDRREIVLADAMAQPFPVSLPALRRIGTHREIGAMMGLSESRVCQLHKRILSQLRRHLYAQVEAAA